MKELLRRRVSLLEVYLTLTVVALVVTIVTACAPQTIVTGPGRVAFSADTVVIRINELQNAVIQANATKAIDDATTKVIVTWAVAADQTLKATPTGWQATVKAGWLAVKPKIPTSNPAIAITVGAVDALIGAL